MKILLLITLAIIVMGALILAGCAQPSPSTAPKTSAPPASTAPSSATKPSTAPASTSATAPAPAKTQSSTQAKVIKLAHPMPPAASISRAYDWWKNEFEKRTEGRYQIQVYPSGTLLSTSASLEGVKNRITDIGYISFSMFPKDFALNLVSQLPGYGYKMKTANDYVLATQSVWEFIDKFPELQAEFKDLKLVWFRKMSPGVLTTSKKEVRLPSDFKGLRIGGGGQKMELITANGGAAMYEMPPAIFENMQKGVVDGDINSFAIVHDFNLYDAANYYQTADWGCDSIMLVMNMDAWNSLGPQDQKIMMDTWNDSNKVAAENGLADEADAQKTIVSKGKKIVNLTAEEAAVWKSASDVCIKKWKADSIAVGRDPKVLDKLLAGWTEIQQKYQNMMTK